MAPLIKPAARSAPSHVVRGISSSDAAINSAIPVPILPHGSMPILEKIYTDSGDAENLKNKVCNKITAATRRKSQVAIALNDI